jgi:uracil-DNA glycosylase family 4
MSKRPEAVELLKMLREAREHAEFLGELGISSIDISLQPVATTPIVAPAASQNAGLRLRPIKPSPSARVASARVITDTLFEDDASTPVFPKPTETLENIWQDIGDCTRCGLCEGRTQVVNTHGSHSARLMFIGEAPGADEDAQGKPFVGRAGQLLTKMIEAMGMKREEVIIGNVNRCRPPGNRQPTLEEAAICRPFLFREIAVIQPEVIVVMGNTALRNLLEVREGITRVRGKFQDFRGIKVMPTFHPAYLLRDPSKKKETWEDLKMVRDYLQTNPPRAKS